jgi:pyridoxal phosphate enzyme (YggS family)
MTSSIKESIAQIRATLPESVRLIAVSKQVSVEAMREAYAAGIRDFGENRIQEATTKQAQLQELSDITWHFIGHLQSNKAKKALEQFQWIHSVDSLQLARRLNELAGQLSIIPDICLQVKMLPDPHKSGWSLAQILQELPELNQCENLRIKGLMTIPPLGLKDLEIFNVFQNTRELAQKIQQQNWSNIHIQELSMGMSSDYQLAIEAGATMIRLGTILFGERISPCP